MISGKNDLVTMRTLCPVCSSENRVILFKAKHDEEGFLKFIKYERFYSKAFYEEYSNGPLKELVYEIAECKDCHFVYQTEILNDKGMGLLYNDWLDKELLKAYYAQQAYSTYEEGMLKVIKKHFGKKGKINIMDFGAGYGNFCSIAAKLGANTFAFDLSADKNGHINNMGVTIINNFDNYKGFFDFIYVNQVFEHLSDPAGILKTLRECLTEKGIIFMAVPNCKKIKSVIKNEGLSNNLFLLLSPHQHINAFENCSLKLLAKKQGLRCLTIPDFLSMLDVKFGKNETKFWTKSIVKSSWYGTFLFFTPIEK
jgi:SAM-dependent methyltransferase